MEEKIKFSIIVPVYNVAQYLEECIESVLGQTYQNFQLILVDDASEDNSVQICQRYCERDNRIQLIRKQHGGPSQTRNFGLRAADGDYVTFLDGDDYWDNKHLQKLEAALCGQRIDMCIANNHYVFTREEQRLIKLFDVPEKAVGKYDIIKLFFDRNSYLPGAMCLITFSRRFIVENHLFFTEELDWSEDLDYFLQGLSQANNLALVNHSFYYYRQDNMDSTTKNMYAGKVISRISVYRKWYHYFASEDREKWPVDLILDKLRNGYREQILICHQVKKSDARKKELLAQFKADRAIWLKPNNSVRFLYTFYIIPFYVIGCDKIKKIIGKQL